MTTLGIIALVLGLASFIAGIVSYARNRAVPKSDEEAPRAVQADLDLFRVDDEFRIDDDAVEVDMQHPGATKVRDAGQPGVTHPWATSNAEPKG